MNEAEGVGLAAPQVGISLQIAVVDLRKVEKRPSSLEIAGQPVDWKKHMPLFFCNPVLTLTRKRENAEEGCLSFPEIYGDVERQGEVEVTAWNERGEEYRFKAGGLLARAVQHEFDHLNGILFIDRMDSATRADVRPDVEALLAETKARMLRK